MRYDLRRGLRRSRARAPPRRKTDDGRMQTGSGRVCAERLKIQRDRTSFHHARKDGRIHRRILHQSAHEKAHPHLCGRLRPLFLRHGSRHGSRRARRERLCLFDEIQSARNASHHQAQRRGDRTSLLRRRHSHQQFAIRRTVRRRSEGSDQHLPFPANATGAHPSPSFTASIAAPFPYPTKIFPSSSPTT